MFNWLTSEVVAHVGAVVMTFVFLITPVTAQTAKPGVYVRVRPPAEALQMLESNDPEVVNRVTTVIVAAFQPDDSTRPGRVKGNYDEYTDEERDALLAGLELIASRSEVHSDTYVAAFSLLRSLGLGPPIPMSIKGRVPAILLRFYRQNANVSRRTMTVHLLGDLLATRPPEEPEIIALLTAILIAAPAPGKVSAENALEALINAGPAGNAILRALHAAQAVKDHMARVQLEAYARLGFPLEGSPWHN